MTVTYSEKLKSIGDLFSEKVDTACSSIKSNFQKSTTSIKSNFQKSTTGIKLTYNIQELQKEKDILEKRIGRRLSVLRRKDLALAERFSEDTLMKTYFDRLDVISDDIEKLLEERKNYMKTTCAQA
ncbi:MAG: hypothetical protein HQK75_08770 [Candidatus Magnetomorum sp.]|nr:hypothetical protein [Candidatus Magnetomorum sp.]